MKWLKTAWKDPVGAGLITAAIVGISGVVFTTIKGWWPAVGTGISVAWSWLGQHSSLPNWLLLLLWPSLALVILVTVVDLIKSTTRSSGEGHDWREYTRDNFLGVDWQWRYATGNANIYSMTPLCPHCKCQLVANSLYTYPPETDLHCEFCARSVAKLAGDFGNAKARLELLIHRNLRTGDWQQRKQSIDAQHQ